VESLSARATRQMAFPNRSRSKVVTGQASGNGHNDHVGADHINTAGPDERKPDSK